MTSTTCSWASGVTRNCAGMESSWTEVTSGVPQGSVLGPVLFLIFINDLPSDVTGDTKIFEDDTKVYRTVDTQEEREGLQEDIDNLSEWSHRWQLAFNASKCKVLHLGKKNQEYEYTMTNESEERRELSSVQHEKDLGVIIDTKLTFRDHVAAIAGKANRILGMIRRTFQFLDQNTFITLDKALVRPHLEYASTVWSPRFKRDMNTVERVQRRATKLVPGLKDMTYNERLRALNLPTLAFRRIRADMIQVFKTMKGIDDTDPTALFEVATYGATRGHTMKIMKKNCRLGTRQHFFTNRIIKEWNNLPQSAIDQETVNGFKNSLEHAWKFRADKFDYIF